MSIDTHFVPPNPVLQFFGKFTAFFLLAMCALGGILSIIGSGVGSGDIGADGTLMNGERLRLCPHGGRVGASDCLQQAKWRCVHLEESQPQ